MLPSHQEVESRRVQSSVAKLQSASPSFARWNCLTSRRRILDSTCCDRFRSGCFLCWFFVRAAAWCWCWGISRSSRRLGLRSVLGALLFASHCLTADCLISSNTTKAQCLNSLSHQSDLFLISLLSAVFHLCLSLTFLETITHHHTLVEQV